MNLSLELEFFGNSGIYGNNNSFPIFRLDNYGRITDVSLVTVTTIDLSENITFQKDIIVEGNIIGELSGNSLTSNKWKESKILNVNGNVS